MTLVKIKMVNAIPSASRRHSINVPKSIRVRWMLNLYERGLVTNETQ